MKKIIIGFLLISNLIFCATAYDCRQAVIDRGFTIVREHITAPDSGGEISRNFGATKDGHHYSIYVEISCSGKVIVFDVLKVF